MNYLKQTLKTDLALAFAESFSSLSKDNYFLFLGKTTPWEDEENPPSLSDTFKQELESWRDMILLAKITKNNVLVGVTRYNWEYNKIFEQYDDSLELFSNNNTKQFYCITDELNVYKCISNNYNAKSTFKPTGTTPEEQVTEDGYVWKFLLKIREELRDFITDEFIPLEKLDSILFNDERTLQNNVKLSSIPGSIENVVLVQIGGSYPLSIITDPEGTEQKNRIVEVINTNTFKLTYSSDLDKTNSIYNDYYDLYISQGPGAGSKSTITSYIVDDETITITTDKGLPFVTTDSIFRIYPKIEVTGDGRDASIIPVMNSDKIITGFTVLNSGKNYHYATIKVYRKNETYSNITMARPIISPVFGHGFDPIRELGADQVLIYVPISNIEKKTDLNVVNILKNEYRQVGILKNAYFNNNTFEIINTNDNLKSYLEIENPNSKSVIYFKAPTGVGGTQELNISEGDIIKQGSEFNQYQARGIVDSIEVVENDSDSSFDYYIITVSNTSGRFLSIDSSTYPLVNELNTGDLEITGSITGVVVSNLYDENTFTPNNYIIGVISNSTAKIVKWECDPYGLSGKLYIDNIKGSFNSSYYTKDSSSIILVRGENIIQYSQIDSSTSELLGTSSSSAGIIKSYKTEEIAIKKFYKVTSTFNITPSSGVLTSTLFSPDQIITNQNGVLGKVVSYQFKNSSSAVLEVNGLTGAFSLNENIYSLSEDNEPVVTNARISSIVPAEVLPYYGDIVYIQNVVPVLSTSDAEEQIKLIIKF